MMSSRSGPPPARGARLLVIKPKMIGDTLLATPALQALHRARPDLRLDIVVRTGSEGVLAAAPPCGRVLLTVPPDDERRRTAPGQAWRWIRRLREIPYDLACDLTGTERGHFILLGTRAHRKLTAPPAWDLHQAWLWRHLLPTAEIPEWNLLHAVERDAAVLGQFVGLSLTDLSLDFPSTGTDLPAALPARYAVIQPGSRRPEKLWPEERWREIVRFLVRECGHVVLSSGRDPTELAMAERLAMAASGATTVSGGRWSWTELAAVMRGAQIFAGSDTAAAHLAAAVQLPAVVVWGPSHEHIWAPWSDRAWIVVNDTIVAAPATRRHPPAPDALSRPTAANQVVTVETALRLALAAPGVSGRNARSPSTSLGA